MKPELISFKICPFVQRLVIILQEKGVDYDVTYINLAEPPEWFKEISPLGKVPVLKLGDDVLFESAVIMEYLDETHPPSLHPADPLKKAYNRAWIELASVLFMTQMEMATAQDEETCSAKEQEIRDKLALVEAQIAGPMFNGDNFSLIDAAYAPLFMRLELLESWCPMGLMDNLPRIKTWSDLLLARDTVKNSVVEEMPQLYRGRINASGGYGASRFGEKQD